MVSCGTRSNILLLLSLLLLLLTLIPGILQNGRRALLLLVRSIVRTQNVGGVSVWSALPFIIKQGASRNGKIHNTKKNIPRVCVVPVEYTLWDTRVPHSIVLGMLGVGSRVP